MPRTFKEICAVSNSSKKDIGRCFKTIKKEVDTNYNTTTPADLIVSPYFHNLINLKFYNWTTFVRVYKTRFCSKLVLPKPVQKLATHIVTKGGNIESIVGKAPTTLAAAAIYLACEVSKTSRSFEEISKICGAAVTTIKLTAKPMQMKLNELLPDEYKNQGQTSSSS